ncbi:AAEL013399-PA, partial [Aedes aegypti]
NIFQLPTVFDTPSSLCDKCIDKLHSAYDLYQHMILSTDRASGNTESSPDTSRTNQDSPQIPCHPCGICELTFENDLSLQRHRKLLHAKIIIRHYYCLHCSKTFKTNRGLDQHSTYCHKTDGEPFRCEQCFRDFTTKTSYINHLAHHVDFLCKFCDHGFFNEIKLLDHVKTNHCDRLFKCNRCSKTEQLRKTLNRHLRTAHNVQQDEFYCGHCTNGCSYNDLAVLNDHIQEAHKSLENDGDYTELLNEPFFEKMAASKSNSLIGGDPTLPDNLFCTLCDKKFISISGLKYHLKRHTDIKAFACVYCSKKFTANSNLNAHIRNKHSLDKSYVCPECDQNFACKDHLTKHIRSKHRQERAFKCPECSKCYFQKSHLNDHVAASHLGYKAFVCELCNTSYSCRGSLRRHLAKTH